jgi:hypothetical protein
MHTFPSPKIYDALDCIMSYYPDRYTEIAKVEIETLLNHCVQGIHNDSEKFLTTLVIKALHNLIGPTGIDEHIYLKKYEITQIELFNLLIKEFPFVKWGHEIVNDLICNKLNDLDHAIIIDIGIGQGIQMINLLNKLKQNKSLKQLVLLGIEPFDDALSTSVQNMNKIKDDLPFNFRFIPLQAFIQNIDLKILENCIGEFEGEIIVNSSLAMHHIQTLEERIRVLGIMRTLNPIFIVLAEPNTDHFEPDFYRRFRNCYQHFYHIFQVVDSLDIDNQSKNGLKMFFGREIEDIIGRNNEERYEKHEPAYRWIEKLVNSGFVIRNHFIDNLPFIGGGVEIGFNDQGFLGFTFASETLLSIIYAESDYRNI